MNCNGGGLLARGCRAECLATEQSPAELLLCALKTSGRRVAGVFAASPSLLLSAHGTGPTGVTDGVLRRGVCLCFNYFFFGAGGIAGRTDVDRGNPRLYSPLPHRKLGGGEAAEAQRRRLVGDCTTPRAVPRGCLASLGLGAPHRRAVNRPPKSVGGVGRPNIEEPPPQGNPPPHTPSVAPAAQAD
ncbi:uncharacterized protein Tco025E_05835 [Trypanosoma conorhini]|uniref:Uncharacterized protein n=1 Tax=Trypanosoma conorhini TaxID=83891 RepID=A0A422P9R8_9TRYP|nr:uncharacterized protein Tco025E_05835 [Trypanosoma conorhini]RNF14465.1 hypothetical protein Tco025E_05835 [Trypanosoma conorhini]